MTSLLDSPLCSSFAEFLSHWTAHERHVSNDIWIQFVIQTRELVHSSAEHGLAAFSELEMQFQRFWKADGG